LGLVNTQRPIKDYERISQITRFVSNAFVSCLKRHYINTYIRDPVLVNKFSTRE